jgi:hypothetical protein
MPQVKRTSSRPTGQPVYFRFDVHGTDCLLDLPQVLVQLFPLALHRLWFGGQNLQQFLGGGQDALSSGADLFVQLGQPSAQIGRWILPWIGLLLKLLPQTDF